jgi:hypothetical protein
VRRRNFASHSVFWAAGTFSISCVIELAGPPADPICTYCGSLTISSSIFITSSGMVAEKSSVWRLSGGGRVAAMRRTSGQKPMSIMRSASSRTNVSTREKSTALLRW